MFKENKLVISLIIFLSLVWIFILVWGLYYQKPKLEEIALREQSKVIIDIREAKRVEEPKEISPVEVPTADSKEESSTNKEPEKKIEEKSKEEKPKEEKHKTAISAHDENKKKQTRENCYFN